MPTDDNVDNNQQNNEDINSDIQDAQTKEPEFNPQTAYTELQTKVDQIIQEIRNRPASMPQQTQTAPVQPQQEEMLTPKVIAEIIQRESQTGIAENRFSDGAALAHFRDLRNAELYEKMADQKIARALKQKEEEQSNEIKKRNAEDEKNSVIKSILEDFPDMNDVNTPLFKNSITALMRSQPPGMTIETAVAQNPYKLQSIVMQQGMTLGISPKSIRADNKLNKGISTTITRNDRGSDSTQREDDVVITDADRELCNSWGIKDPKRYVLNKQRALKGEI